MRLTDHLTSLALSTLLACATLCSCSSSKSAVAPDTTGMSRELQAAGINVDELGTSQSLSIAKAVAASYTPWQRVGLKGKVRLEGVPLALNTKIYMERGSSVLISISAPILGEVGRLEMSADSALLVNKRSKTWCKVSIAKYLSRLGASLTDVQDLVLGRVFLLGSGTLTQGNASMVQVSEGASDTWIFTPKVQHPDAQYGFTLYKDGLLSIAAAFTNDEKYMATAHYNHSMDGTDMDISLVSDGRAKPMQIGLSLSLPEYNATPLEPIQINPKWTETTISAWLKSLK